MIFRRKNKDKTSYTGITCLESVERAAERALESNDFALHFRLIKIANKLRKGKM